MALEDVVNVVVNINQATVAQQGFGTPLIYGYHLLSDRVLTFKAGTWSAAMIDEGFTKDSAVYRCAEKMMIQSPRPATFKVGRATSPLTQIAGIKVLSAVEGAAYKVTVRAPDGTEQSAAYVALAADTPTIIATGLATAIDAMTAVSASATADVVTVTSAEDRMNSITVGEGLTLTDKTVANASEISDDLDAIRDLDNDWYALCLTTGAPDAIMAAATWVEANRKLMVASTSDHALLEEVSPALSDIATDIEELGYVRTHVAYHSKDGEFYGPAWTSKMLVWEPGQADWKFKTLAGVTTDKLTPTEEMRLLGKNASYYESLAGEPSTGAAMGGDGTFLDLVQLSDWLRARATEGIVRGLKGPPKTAFTDEGGGNMIWGVLRNVALRGIDNTAIVEDPATWSVFVPKKKDLDPADVVARRWTGAILNVTPTGAVHSVGTITININVAQG